MVIILEIPRLYIRDVNDKTIATLDSGDYFDDTLTRFLAGKASVFEFSIYKKEGDYELFSAGRKISFRFEDEDFWLNILTTDQDEKTLTVTAVSLNLELNNETVGPYKGTSKSFQDYFNTMVNNEVSLELGLNEVADKKISNEWTGTSTKLARLFSLANVFDAEVEFETVLNREGSLKKIVLNVYRAHSENYHGIGKNRTNEVFRFGNDIKTVRKKEDITNIYTAIRPYGKDGLSLANVEHEVLDENGNLLYATYKTEKSGFPDRQCLFAPQSRLSFLATLNEGDGWIVNTTDEMEYEDAEKLYAYALGELKKNCIPEVEWEIEGYIKGRIGDTIRVADSGYKPEIYLDARITEQTISFTKPSQNKSTFSNVKELQSQVSTDLLKEMEKIIEANKVYSCTISTDNGIIFKNGEGSTTLTAIVRDSAVEVTDKFSIEWFKDGIFLDTGAEITVKASDVDGKSVYKFVAKKTDETVAGMYEVTVTDVSDGKDGLSAYVHQAWANSPDGTADFTTVYPDESIESYPKYMGTCSNHSETAPTDPSAYHWEVDPTYLEHSKVGGDQYDSDQSEIYEVIGGKADSEEFQALKREADALLESYNSFVSEGGKYEQDLENIENRAIGLIEQLNDKIAQFEFIKTYIRMGEEGLEIGAQDSTMKMLLTKESLSFMDGGKVVAYFTQQSFYINRGAIVESLQLGNFKFSTVNDDLLVLQYVG